MTNPNTHSLADVYGTGEFGLSFELFTPKTEAGEKALYRHDSALIELGARYITCTYGAGGSTRDKTLEIISEVRAQHGLPVASHLTCVGSTVDDLRQYLSEAQRAGVDYIVALRGDPPKGETEFKPVAGGLRYANELVELLRREFPQFGIAVAGYPEKHQEAPSAEVDLENLKRKVEAGADAVITQLFYDNDDFFAFRERYEAAGLTAPLVPGVLPVTNLSQIQRITSLCGAKLPTEFVTRLAEREADDDWQFEIGVEFATEQVQQLIDAGVPGVHFYVLNKSQATTRVLKNVRYDRSVVGPGSHT